MVQHDLPLSVVTILDHRVVPTGDHVIDVELRELTPFGHRRNWLMTGPNLAGAFVRPRSKITRCFVDESVT